MNRVEKAAFVAEMQQSFSGTPHVILASFRGLDVNQATDLRSRVRQAGGRFRVIKNRLAKRAAVGTPVEPLVEQFEGPCAIATHESDPVSLAKTLADFSKENPQLELLAGVVDAKEILDLEGVKQLASLPGLPELRTQLLCLIQTPATQLVRLLGTPGSQVARVLDAHRDRQEQA